MQRRVQIVYVPVPTSQPVPVARPHSVYEFTCPYCQQISEIESLLNFRCECGASWDQIVWQQPAIEDSRPVLSCDNPECEVHA